MFRVLIVLVTGLILMMAIVILRVETARLQHEMSELDSAAQELVEDLRIQQNELARSRNPSLLRESVAEVQLRRQAASQPAEQP